MECIDSGDMVGALFLVFWKAFINISHELNVKIENILIQNVTEQKVHGIYIEEHLSGSSHIDHLYSILASKISLLLCASVYCCLVVTCWERADLLALVCDV